MHFLAFRHLIHEAAVFATPVAGAIAILKGDKPERWGATFYIASIMLGDYCLTLFPRWGIDQAHALLYFEMISTFAQSSFFLYLAVRYGSLWLAAGMAVGGTDFYFNQAFLDAEQPSYSVFAMELNLVAFVVLSTLACAAIWSWCARIRKRQEAMKRAEAVKRREEVWARQYETLLAGRLAEVAVPAPVRNGRAYLTIGPAPS